MAQSSYPDREYYVIAQGDRYSQHYSFDCNNVNNGTAHVRGTNIMACAVQFPAEMSRSFYSCPDTNRGKTLTGEKNNEIYFVVHLVSIYRFMSDLTDQLVDTVSGFPVRRAHVTQLKKCPVWVGAASQ
uniref:Uncharacterized protein n=1 Tax=Timema douglasi TaxID=61478 RepID=A0A7R8V9A6_TIMDO|nr:unnamed protein product [Timema douglasi]